VHPFISDNSCQKTSKYSTNLKECHS
jgi:hypothetical protein